MKTEITQTKDEMALREEKIKGMKKKIPKAILIGICLSLVTPLLPRRGGGTLAEKIGYPYSVLCCAIVYVIIYPIGYVIAEEKLKREIRQLKLKQHLLEKDIGV